MKATRVPPDHKTSRHGSRSRRTRTTPQVPSPASVGPDTIAPRGSAGRFRQKTLAHPRGERRDNRRGRSESRRLPIAARRRRRAHLRGGRSDHVVLAADGPSSQPARQSSPPCRLLQDVRRDRCLHPLTRYWSRMPSARPRPSQNRRTGRRTTQPRPTGLTAGPAAEPRRRPSSSGQGSPGPGSRSPAALVT